jgi:hypothetical protein
MLREGGPATEARVLEVVEMLRRGEYRGSESLEHLATKWGLSPSYTHDLVKIAKGRHKNTILSGLGQIACEAVIRVMEKAERDGNSALVLRSATILANLAKQADKIRPTPKLEELTEAELEAKLEEAKGEGTEH